jgi:hypothetical protein
MKTNHATLSCGIVIIEDREAESGLRIENQFSINVHLLVRKKEVDGKKEYYFFALTHGLWLGLEDLANFQAELETIKQAIIEADNIFNINIETEVHPE